MCRHDCGVALYPPPEVGGFTATTDKFVGAAALGGALGFASPVTGIRSGSTALATGFASTYIPTRFGGKYW